MSDDKYSPMTFDGEDKHFNIRRLGNLYRVSIHRRPDHNLFYVGIDALQREEDGSGTWKYIRGTCTRCYTNEPEAIGVAKDYYKSWSPGKVVIPSGRTQ